MKFAPFVLLAAAHVWGAHAEDCPKEKKEVRAAAVPKHRALRHHPAVAAKKVTMVPAKKAPAKAAPAKAAPIKAAPVKAASVKAASTTDSGLTSSSGDPLNIQPGGVPGFPLDGPHLKATEPSLAQFPIPAGALTYPQQGIAFDCSAFNNWTTHIRDTAAQHPSKHIIVPAGTYIFDMGTATPESLQDPNLDLAASIQFFAWPAGWTLDLRGVTFSITKTRLNWNRRPSNAFYINQCPEFTILGGTIWTDQGEIFSYMKVTSLVAQGGDDQFGTLELSKGYNASVWATDQVNARNVGCLDVSGWPHHVKEATCNLWYMNNYKFDAATNTATAIYGKARSGITVGTVLTRISGPNLPGTIDSEDEGTLKVYGMTTNGGLGQVGDNNKGAPALYDGTMIVNPPPRPGLGPRYGGPAMQFGHIGSIFDSPSVPHIQFKNSQYQRYGGDQDLRPLGVDEFND